MEQVEGERRKGYETLMLSVHFLLGNNRDLIMKSQSCHGCVPIPDNAFVADRAPRKLKTKGAEQIYSEQKETLEAVLGKISEARGIRAFLLRGPEKVKDEWKLVCLTHNIFKLWRHLWWANRRSVPVFG